MSLAIGMKTHVSVLQEHLLRLGHVPQYDLVRDDTGTHIPTFTYRLEYDNHVVEGTGSSKKEAKQTTARLMLEKLNITGQEVAKVEADEAIPNKKVNKYNSVGALTDYCVNMKIMQGATYFDVREEGPPHAKLFTVRCTVSQLSETAVCGTKKQAKQLAAQQMLTKLKSLNFFDDENISSSPGSLSTPNAVHTIDNVNTSSSSVSLSTSNCSQSQIDPQLLKRVQDHFRALRVFSAQHICGNNISLYHKVFKSEIVASESAVNLAARLKNSTSVNWDLTPIQDNYEEFFKEIISEMGLEGTFSEIPGDGNSTVLLSINHSPHVTFLGLGDTNEAARKKVIVDYLLYLCVLIS